MKELRIDLEVLAKQYGFDVLGDETRITLDDDGRLILVLQGDVNYGSR